MTDVITARFYQHAPGTPLEMSLTHSQPTSADYNASAGEGFGVKATSAPPTNVSDFAGHTIQSNDASMDRSVQTSFVLFMPGNVASLAHAEVTDTKTKVLDADWAAGKYAFAYSLLAAGAISKASPPYHIR